MRRRPCTPNTARDARAGLRSRLAVLSIALTLAVSLLVTTSAAEAVVLSVNGSRYGVALVPGTSTAALPTVTSNAQCSDPWLSPDLAGPRLPPGALCWQGGGATPSAAVMHANETFAITWDPIRADWATTRDFVEQYLRDVADGTNTLTSPYALTTQYNDYGGRAANASKYAGGCIDYGNPGGSACQFGNTIGTGAGNNYGASGCTPTGTNQYCLTDTQVQSELKTMINSMGLVGRLQPGYTPLLVLLAPPGVQVCLDSTSPICSYYDGSSSSMPEFCSYHAYLTVGGTRFAYVVQPWTTFSTSPWKYGKCDEPNLPAVPSPVSAQQLASYAGMALVNPVSQSEIAAIVNPWLNGWFANDGAEIDDNGCGPGGDPYDAVVVGASAQNPYYLQPELNNAGAIEIDPNALACELGVTLAPTFVVPSPVDRGDVVAFDGSVTDSTLIVPSADYHWNLGDGTTSIGPSIVHAYAYGGTYTVTLNLTDRGGNTSTISQTVDVLGPGKPGPPGPNTPGLSLRAQLMPQGLRSVLRSGIVMRVTSSVRTDGIVTLTISHAAARRAHIKSGPGPTVAVGRGTVSGIKSGTVTLHLRLAPGTATKLRHLGHVTVTVRLLLFASGGRHIALEIAGRY